MPVITSHPKTMWTTFQQGVARLAQAPGQALTQGLRQVSHLPAMASMKARAAAHDLGHQWQATARSTSRSPAPSHPRGTPAPLTRTGSSSAGNAAKAKFFAEHRDQLRSQHYWARQDESGQWQLAPHESNALHQVVEAGGGLLEGAAGKAYDLVTIPAQIAEFAASPAGEKFRTQPTEVTLEMAARAKRQAQRLAFDIPSGKAMDDAVKPFVEGTTRERGKIVGGLTVDLATLLPVAKLAQGAQKFTRAVVSATDLAADSIGLMDGIKGGRGILRKGKIRGAEGPVSKRKFDPTQAGGPIHHLTTDKVKVTPRGVAYVEKHVARFGEDPLNEAMVQRLKEIAAGTREATQTDLNYYTHELRESVRYRKLGWKTGQPVDPDEAYLLWNNAHTATLEDYRIQEGPGVLYDLELERRFYE